MQPIHPAPPPGVRLPTMPASTGETAPHPSFRDMLVQGLQDVNSMQLEADQAVESMLTGGSTDPAEVLTAVQKADLAFKMMMQIRNKLVEAYQQVQNIPI